MEIWRTLFWCSWTKCLLFLRIHLMDVYHRVSWCCFVGSFTSSTLSVTSCESTCEPFRCMFLSLDLRLNIHPRCTKRWPHFVYHSGSLVFETLPHAWQKPLPSSKEMSSLDAKSLVLTSSRATRPTFIESFFVVRRGEGLPRRILTVAGRVPEGLVRRARHPSRPTRSG